MSRYDLTYFERATCYNRFVLWRKAGVWGDRLMDVITAAHDGNIQMSDSISVRAHQQAATAKGGYTPVERHGRILDLYSPQDCANYFSACGYDAD